MFPDMTLYPRYTLSNAYNNILYRLSLDSFLIIIFFFFLNDLNDIISLHLICTIVHTVRCKAKWGNSEKNPENFYEFEIGVFQIGYYYYYYYYFSFFFFLILLEQ